MRKLIEVAEYFQFVVILESTPLLLVARASSPFVDASRKILNERRLSECEVV